MEIKEILRLPIGTALQKGKSKRIIVGFNGFMIMYKTNLNSKRVTGLAIHEFAKWAKNAEIA